MVQKHPIVEAKDVVKGFKNNQALNSLNMQVNKGELYGLVGPDGAGKTTSLRIFAGLMGIDDGEIVINGIDILKNPEAIKPNIGYMAQQFSLYGELTVEENLIFFAELFNVGKRKRDERSRNLLEFAGLSEFRRRRASHLSGGMQKKLALACTLIHEPALLLLDEPTTGVDPVSRREFWDILSNLHLQGVTILISTPYMDEAERCTMVGLIYKGQITQSGTPIEMLAQLKGELLELHSKDWREAEKLISEVEGVIEIQTYGDTLRIFVDSIKKRKKKIQIQLKEEEIAYSSLRAALPRMEDVFISLINRMEE